MFNIRDFSNATIALLIIMALASAFTVRALTYPAAEPVEFKLRRVNQLDTDPNMSFEILTQDVRIGVGNTFGVTVAVRNVKEMYGWQLYLCYDPAVLECLEVSAPSNNVFSSSITVSGALAEYDNAEFAEGPLQMVRNDKGWVLAGDCLLGVSQPTFHGSGVLCQIEFKAVSSGASALALLHDLNHVFQTYILTSDLRAITASSASYSYVIVTSI